MKVLKRDISRLTSSDQSFFKVARLLLSYRLLPVVLLRQSQWLRKKRVPIIPDIISMLNFILFGIEVAKQCEIGPGLIIAHSQGVVIGAWKIGSNLTVFSSVTIGAKGLGVPFKEDDRPFIGNGVTIGSGAKIIGGIKIGDNSIIGANSVITKDVPPNTIAMGVPAVYKKKG